MTRFISLWLDINDVYEYKKLTLAKIDWLELNTSLIIKITGKLKVIVTENYGGLEFYYFNF